MSGIKIGVVGAGIYGRYHVQTYLASPDVDEVVVCDTNPETLQKVVDAFGVKGYTSVSEMVENEELSGVAVCTPDPYHFIPIRDAIQAGVKKVFCEKPLATSVEEAKEIERLAAENNVSIYLDFHKRWDPAYNAIRNKIVKSGDKVIRGYMSLDDVIDVPMNWFTWTNRSTPNWFVGIHCIDLMRYITNSEVKQVYAVGSKTVLAGKGYDTYDSISAILTFEDGSQWTLENSWILPNSFPKSNDGQLIVLTENQYFKNESYRGLKTYDQKKESLPNYIFMDFEDNSGFGLEPMQDFVRFLKDGTPVRSTLEDGVRATCVAQAIHDSVELGTAVIVEY